MYCLTTAYGCSHQVSLGASESARPIPAASPTVRRAARRRCTPCRSLEEVQVISESPLHRRAGAPHRRRVAPYQRSEEAKMAELHYMEMGWSGSGWMDPLPTEYPPAPTPTPPAPPAPAPATARPSAPAKPAAARPAPKPAKKAAKPARKAAKKAGEEDGQEERQEGGEEERPEGRQEEREEVRPAPGEEGRPEGREEVGEEEVGEEEVGEEVGTPGSRHARPPGRPGAAGANEPHPGPWPGSRCAPGPRRS